MNSTNKTALGIGIAAVVVLLAIFAMRMYDARHDDSLRGDAALPTPASDTSDSALDKDSAAIDAQLSGLNEDSATADAGLSEAQ